MHCVFFISEHLSWSKMCIFGGSFLTQVNKCHCGSWHTLVQKASFKIMLPHVDITQWVRKALKKKEGPHLDSKWSLNCLLNNPVLVLSQEPTIRSFFLQATNKKGTFNKTHQDTFSATALLSTQAKPAACSCNTSSSNPNLCKHYPSVSSQV